MAKTLAQIVALNEILSDAFNVSYSEALAAKANWVNLLATEVPVRQKAALFPFQFNNAGIQRKQIGESPDFNHYTGEYVRVVLEKWTAACRIDQVDFEDPFLQSQLLAEVQGFATQLALFPINRMADALNNGESDTYYTMWDGQQLFANAHVMPNGSTFDNLQAGALNSTNFTTGMSLLKRVPWGPSGRYFPTAGATFYLIVPPELEYTARELMENSLLPSATYNTENVYKGAAEVIVEENLDDVNDWFLAMAWPNKKPFVHAIHETVNRTLVPKISPDDPNVYLQDEYQWVIKSFEEVFPTQFWQLVKFVN